MNVGPTSVAPMLPRELILNALLPEEMFLPEDRLTTTSALPVVASALTGLLLRVILPVGVRVRGPEPACTAEAPVPVRVRSPVTARLNCPVALELPRLTLDEFETTASPLPATTVKKLACVLTAVPEAPTAPPFEVRLTLVALRSPPELMMLPAAVKLIVLLPEILAATVIVLLLAMSSVFETLKPEPDRVMAPV